MTEKLADRIISADDHIDLCYLPPDLFQKRMAGKYKDQAPVVRDTPRGKAWLREDAIWSNWGAKGLDFRINVFDRLGYPEEVEPGIWRASDPKYRLKDMDADGVDAQVMYNFTNWSYRDPELKAAVIQAFNTWLAEEVCAYAPNRLIGLASLPSHDAKAAIDEMVRCRKLGLRGVIFDVFSPSKPIFDPMWEPLWSAAEETGMPVAVHTGGGTASIHVAPSGTPWKYPVCAALFGMQLDECMASMIMSGILERHPKMKLVLGEGGIGWIPFMLERLEYEVQQFRSVDGGKPPIKQTPTEIFRQQVRATFQDETFGVEMIPRMGVETVMWAADYPHGDGTFPYSQKAIERMFGKADAHIRDRVLGGNCAELYGIA